jgi:hypothetical protein
MAHLLGLRSDETALAGGVGALEGICEVTCHLPMTLVLAPSTLAVAALVVRFAGSDEAHPVPFAKSETAKVFRAERSSRTSASRDEAQDIRPAMQSLRKLTAPTPLVQNTACPKDIAATTIMIAIMIAPINRIFAIPAVAADTPENPKNPATMEIRKNISAHFNISPLPTAALSQPAGVELVPNAWETFGANPWPACLRSASSLAIVEVFQARSHERNLTPALAKGGRLAHLSPRRPSAT